MTASYTYDGDELLTVRRGTVELTQCAESGNVGTGKVTINDKDGTLAIIGQKDFAADESACSNGITARGFIAARDWYRGPNSGTGRDIDVVFEDLNAMAAFRLIGSDGNRTSQETVAARGAWIMGSDYVTGLFADNGRCDFSSDVMMDKADYRNQHPGEVLADMALAQTGVNRYIRDFGDGPEQVFRNDNTSEDDTSDVRISTSIEDVDGDETGLTFYPFKDFRLSRSPAAVISKLAYSYAKGTVVVERTDTADDFNGERSGTASNANVKTADEASAQATAQLNELSTEEDVLEGTILMPRESVNLINQGDRMSARWEYLGNTGGRDYDEFTWFRVLECTKKPLLKAAAKYEVRLKLSPQEVAPTPDICDDLYPPTPSDTYYPLGGSGGTPNVSDGVVFYWRAGFEYPGPGKAGLQGSWHFGAYGLGGAGTTDYAGDCVQNRLIFILVGNGEAVIQTETYGGTFRGLTLYQNGVLVASGTSGDAFTLTIDDRVDGYCVTYLEMRDTGLACGSKWGFSGMEWTAA